MAKHTLKEIMQMNFDDLEECIAAMSTDDPRLDFSLKQRDFLSQRHSHKLTLRSAWLLAWGRCSSSSRVTLPKPAGYLYGWRPGPLFSP